MDKGISIFETGKSSKASDRGRPPLKMDVSLLLKYHEEGCSCREIARKYYEETGKLVSYITIWRRIKKRRKNDKEKKSI